MLGKTKHENWNLNETTDKEHHKYKRCLFHVIKYKRETHQSAQMMKSNLEMFDGS